MLYKNIETGKIYDKEELKDLYNDSLNYEEVKIGHFTFDASEILEKLDSIAYECGFNDFLNDYEEVEE